MWSVFSKRNGSQSCHQNIQNLKMMRKERKQESQKRMKAQRERSLCEEGWRSSEIIQTVVSSPASVCVCMCQKLPRDVIQSHGCMLQFCAARGQRANLHQQINILLLSAAEGWMDRFKCSGLSGDYIPPCECEIEHCTFSGFHYFIFTLRFVLTSPQ